MNSSLDIRVRITHPFQVPHEIGFRLEVSERYMRPLPRDRELPWAIRERATADAIMQERRHIAECVARDLTQKIMEAFSADDTVNGYTRAENEAFYKPR